MLSNIIKGKEVQDLQKLINQGVKTTDSPAFVAVSSFNPATLPEHVPRLDQMQDLISGISWKEPVISRFDPTSGLPSSPSLKNRYISTATANGWSDKYIYEWDGSSWDETVPLEGVAVFVKDEDKKYNYTSSGLLNKYR